MSQSDKIVENAMSPLADYGYQKGKKVHNGLILRNTISHPPHPVLQEDQLGHRRVQREIPPPRPKASRTRQTKPKESRAVGAAGPQRTAARGSPAQGSPSKTPAERPPAEAQPAPPAAARPFPGGAVPGRRAAGREAPAGQRPPRGGGVGGPAGRSPAGTRPSETRERPGPAGGPPPPSAPPEPSTAAGALALPGPRRRWRRARGREPLRQRRQRRRLPCGSQRLRLLGSRLCGLIPCQRPAAHYGPWQGPPQKRVARLTLAPASLLKEILGEGGKVLADPR
ncbi:proline-rich protein 2-like [Mustela erminea]|uniref:proline-rich protein 2-like n=1 Tax=Mustela erminea TaxID=36723 RepID=UPI00138666F0|nr:proline-rich protein 2-like [Mustela erminea]